MNVKSTFIKKASKDWLLKAFPIITDFSEASVPLIIGLSITRPNQKAEWGRGTWGLGEQLGICTGETQHWVSLVTSVFFFLKK